MKYFIESEKRHRYINKVKQGERPKFLDWDIKERLNKGTDTITVHALRSSVKLNFRFEKDEIKDEIVAKFPAIIKNENQTENNTEDDLPRENNQQEEAITSSKQITYSAMKRINGIQYGRERESICRLELGHVLFRHICKCSLITCCIAILPK